MHVFVAYPEKPRQVADCIRLSVEQLNQTQSTITFTTWEENDIAGRPLVAPIFSKIDEASFLVADVTKLNFNVTYEIGYAIGRGQRIFLVRNSTIDGDDEVARLVGIFDTLGYEKYQNVEELAALLASDINLAPLNTQFVLDQRAPTYVLETPRRSEPMVRMVARVKKARLQYRSFSPSEETRLSASDAIAHVASSYGVLVPLLDPTASDASIHNVRAAFVAGLAHGMRKRTLILQDSSGPVPLDIRDFAKLYRHPNDIDEHIQSFALDIYEAIQTAQQVELPPRGYLADLFVGDPMAENEFQTLSRYYLPTDEFHRALRGDVNLVVGRKGTGKTAFFSQVRDRLRQNRANVVVDLKPEGYQLVKLKEDVLDYLSGGAKAHLITAFWEYLLLMEVCHKVLEKDRERHLRDPILYERYRDLAEIYDHDETAQEGDFSERLLILTSNIIRNYQSNERFDNGRRLTANDITNLLHVTELRTLRSKLSEYLKVMDSAWVLFDNIDKGWTSTGLTGGDIIILRCLIDAARKIQRDMRQDDHEFQIIIFVRNDVYQLLMEQTPDFGKEMRASLDWSDPDRLREMMRMRLLDDSLPSHTHFQTLWGRVAVSHYAGEESSQYLIDRTLMRPRNFLKLFGHCRSSAVNLSHDRIEQEDIEKGIRNYSDDIIVDADQELTDIEPSAGGFIYQFIDEESEFTKARIEEFMELNGIERNKWGLVLEFLLYYGFFGVGRSTVKTRYIYDVGYDIKKLNAVIAKEKDNLRFTLNPVFWPGLGIV